MDARKPEKPSPTTPGHIPAIVAAIATILVGLLGVLLEQYLPIAQLLVITAACAAAIYILLWLPERVGEYTRDYLEYLNTKLEEHFEITEHHRKELSVLHNRVSALCSELIEGTAERMSWTYFWLCVRSLKDKIEADETFQPDVVLSVGRSGAVVGALLAGNMGSKIHLGIDRINEWPKERGRTRRVVKIIPSLQTLSSQLEGKNILCVMSACDTGTTLGKVREELNAIEGLGEVRTAVLFRNVNTIFIPDYIYKDDKGGRPNWPFLTSAWILTSKGPSRLDDQ